jgi:uncharacterized protein YjbJ (UPF0337 family)
MGHKAVDETKGRVKEAAGALSGDSALKNRGRAEQVKGSAKKAADTVRESVTGRKAARGR